MGSSTLESGEMSTPEERDKQRLAETVKKLAPLTRGQLEGICDGLFEGYRWQNADGEMVWEDVTEPGHYEDDIAPLSREIMTATNLLGHEGFSFAGLITVMEANNRLVEMDEQARREVESQGYYERTGGSIDPPPRAGFDHNYSW